MANLIYHDVSKSFDDTNILRSVSLDIRDGELLALLGPSGCGKTTMLRLAAGFEHPTSGSISKNGTILSDVTSHVPPEKRNMGIVFQSYALWPNMTVAENISYPLKIRKLSSEQLQHVLRNALEAVSLEKYADSSPATLSGGQRQRVALARCLVMQPDAVLLDEPLANLDAHLREIMQRIFLDFHRKSGATMVYVTHDQSEAMAMADRIAVMFDGRLAQVASPRTLYDCPANEDIARFVGQSSILTGYLQKSCEGPHRTVLLHGQHFKIRQSQCVKELQEAEPVRICVRPEQVKLHHEEGLPARILSSIYLGERYRVHMEMHDHTEIVAYSSHAVRTGENVRFRFDDSWAFGLAQSG